MIKVGLKVAALLAGVAACAPAIAGPVPYPNSGTPNPVTYTFTAQSTGPLIAYFAGSGASFEEEVGLLVNGVDTGIRGLNDHTSAVGDILNFGTVTAGDSLTFLDEIFTTAETWYSDPAMNADGGNHVYSTAVTANQVYPGSPAGTYVAFEDIDFRSGSDYNYFDDTFIFTNTNITPSTPEASTWAMMAIGFAGLGLAAHRRARRTATATA
jgi:hypothetical protein